MPSQVQSEVRLGVPVCHHKCNQKCHSATPQERPEVPQCAITSAIRSARRCNEKCQCAFTCAVRGSTVRTVTGALKKVPRCDCEYNERWLVYCSEISKLCSKTLFQGFKTSRRLQAYYT
eukprot:1158199-Pelagomonas_calceolata.AAC.9